MTRHVPEGALARARIAGATAVKLGVGQLGHRVKRPFLSAAARAADWQALNDKQARLLFDTLSQLRGTALKVAQMLCMETELLPEAFRRELEKSCHRVPPLNRVLVRKALVDEFGQPPEALFASFDAEAFAAASLGQVHAATLHDGRRVAVKIQYPGIHIAIDSDVALLRQFARGMPNARLALQSLAEIHARLREEVDYRLEAANTTWFRERLGDGQVRVPAVIAERSGTRVLTTCFAPGLHLEDWLQTGPSQETRDLAAQRLYDLFVHSALGLRRLHADPNPGNTLFAADGAITLLDFGCVKDMSPNFIQLLPQVLRAYLADDAVALFDAYEKLGMLRRADAARFYEEILRPFGHWLVEPLRDDLFDFGMNADYTARGFEVIQGLQRLKGLDRLADEFVFFDRTIYGLCKLFERMGARVRLRHHWIDDMGSGGHG
jgi:predicted unusual protein kinase regulating ubiquinone biosynthesis (AarF/ABC1/UbiB family)